MSCERPESALHGTVIDAHAGRTVTDDEIRRFLKTFVMVHDDFQSADSSRDQGNVIDRLKGLLAPQQRDQAERIWERA